MSTTWQVAAGSVGRDYTSYFIRFGIAFVGRDFEGTIRQIKLGDKVILKRGTSEICAVGQVVERQGNIHGCGDKDWLCDFDGWDLGAYCNVNWHVPNHPREVSGLTRTTIQEVHKEELLVESERILKEFPRKADYEKEPLETTQVQDDQILEELIREGLRPLLAENLANEFRRIRLLAQYYYNEGSWPDIREHETRTFLIIPLLLGLGWAEQQIKIELPASRRRRVDVACFSRPYRRDRDGNPNNDDCVLIVESKDFKSGLHYAHEQAKAYAEDFPNCRGVVVSNGYCYKAYLRQADGTFNETPSSYINLLRPRDRYPLEPQTVSGALAALKVLLPQSWRRAE